MPAIVIYRDRLLAYSAFQGRCFACLSLSGFNLTGLVWRCIIAASMPRIHRATVVFPADGSL